VKPINILRATTLVAAFASFLFKINPEQYQTPDRQRLS